LNATSVTLSEKRGETYIRRERRRISGCGFGRGERGLRAPALFHPHPFPAILLASPSSSLATLDSFQAACDFGGFQRRQFLEVEFLTVLRDSLTDTLQALLDSANHFSFADLRLLQLHHRHPLRDCPISPRRSLLHSVSRLGLYSVHAIHPVSVRRILACRVNPGIRHAPIRWPEIARERVADTRWRFL
jgi:hypothetical protein